MDSATNPPPSDGGAATTCADIDLAPTADTCLIECAGSNSYGTFPMCNIKVGPLLASFDLDPVVAKDFRDGHATKLALTLADNRTCDGDAGPDNCGSLAPEVGTLTAHVATNNWVEGAARAGYVGATACRRNAGSTTPPAVGWGPSGAAPSEATRISTPADFSSEVGNASISGAAITSLVLPLNPELAALYWKTYGGAANTNRISILVRAPAGNMVVGMRESKRSVPAKLTLTICK